MKTQVRLKGRLKVYLQAFLFLGVALALLTVLIFFIDYKAGFLLSLFVVLYFVVNFLLHYHNKNIILNELISFATQYGQIQKKLLKELDLPHALLDDTGKIIWVNNAFEDVTYQNKCMRKAVNQLFPAVTKDKLPLDRDESEVEIVYDVSHSAHMV